MRTALFWVITQGVVVISYRSFGTTVRVKIFYSGLLRDEYWSFLTDVSGQPICSIFRVQEFKKTAEDGTDRLSPNVGKKSPLLAA
jgi:hypothetical protein